MLLGPINHSSVPFVTVTRRTALRFPAFLWPLTSTRHNHSHLTSIRESSSPVATNQALYITALKPDTHCLVSRLQALHRSHHLPPVDVFLQWTSSSSGRLPPVDVFLQWTSSSSGRLPPVDVFLQWTSSSSGRLPPVDVFLQWTLLRGEIRTTNPSVY